MEIPFVFGKAVSGSHFTDRETETRTLVNNFTYGVNTIIISPRRYGKTSLVKKAGHAFQGKDVKIIYVDIFTARSPQEFGEIYAAAIIKQTSSKMEEFMMAAKEFLGRFRPKFSFDTRDAGEISLTLEIENEKEDLNDILELPEKIAQKKNIRIVVCIDEFQQIGEFADSLYFQRKLRTHWQHHQLTSYCLYGSKKHMMNELFALPSMPFFKFGEVINLKKIPEDLWIEFLLKKFEEVGKSINEALAKRICDLTENYSSYVQQLAWLLWTNYDSKDLDKALDISYNQLLEHSAILFEQQTQDLTAYQINFLKMLLEDRTVKYNSMEAIERYNLGSPANVGRIKTALIKKELIDLEDGRLIIRDPILKAWLRLRL